MNLLIYLSAPDLKANEKGVNRIVNPKHKIT